MQRGMHKSSGKVKRQVPGKICTTSSPSSCENRG